jgi:pimeloyl-ACP methyl ester carboxylesterase
VLPLLEPHCSVLALTLPGHRGGPVVAADADVPALADSLERVLDQAGLETAHLVGNSLGGWLALELAGRGRARSVVAFSPAGSWRNAKDLRRLSRLMRVGRAMGGGRAADVLMSRPGLRRAAMRIASERADLIPAEDVPGVLEDLRACGVLDGVLAGIDRHGPIGAPVVTEGTPVRIAWPTRDRTIPFDRYGQSLVDLIPGVDLVTLPGVGHVPMYDDPQLVATTIVEFVQRCAVEGGNLPRG